MSANETVPVYGSAGQGDFVYLWYGIFMLWTLFMMDVITTEVILSFGGYEINAFMRPFVELPALHIGLKMVVLGVIAAVAYLSDRMTDRYGTIAIIIIAAWYIFVISHNIIQIAAALP